MTFLTTENIKHYTENTEAAPWKKSICVNHDDHEYLRSKTMP